jgi:hypothetical protein
MTILVTAPNLRMAEFWAREQHLRRGDFRVIIRTSDTQWIRGYEQGKEVHWINEGPADMNVCSELFQMNRAGIIKIVQEYT